MLKSNEYITGISGTHGYFRCGLPNHDPPQRSVASLRIHTNLRPSGYGPYGDAVQCDDLRGFSTPLQTNDAIVEIFGRYDVHLDSIGIRLSEANKSIVSSSTMSTHLSVLVSHGSTLAALQRKGMSWKNGTLTTQRQERIIIDPVKVVDDISQILEMFKNAEHESSLEDKSMTKVLRKIGGILRQLIRDDKDNNDAHYGKLVDEIEDCLNDVLKSQKPPSAMVTKFALSSKESSVWDQVYHSRLEELDFHAARGSFTYIEMSCLSFYYSIVSNSANSVKIKKRELIHWWIGMDLIEDALQGEQLLHKLVAEEFLQCALNDNRYTLLPGYKLTEPLRDLQYHSAQKNRLIVMDDVKNDMPGVPPPNLILAAINISAYTLNAKIFDWLFQMREAKVVHIGSWHPGMDYVVVDDMIIRSLNSLKSLKEVRFLSFQGVSRLLELPNSVYNLVELRVLDLRACQDLRSLPKGIELLQKLVHLDLSKCYELHYIPKGITELSKLQVLKGFVINSGESNRLDVLRKHKSSSCPFNLLSKLKKLTKLSVTTRMMNFPGSNDAETLCNMPLTKLKITWVSTRRGTPNQELEGQRDGFGIDGIRRFPSTLKKLELQAAPETTASRLLSLISNRSHNRLEKLYIRGGGLSNLDPEKYYFPTVKLVRFRYMTRLHMNWFDFRLAFPNTTQFEMYACPHLIFFPSDDNGVWECL